ncbi:MAG: hypothetical protein Q8898_15780 [Bacillota bacterium]|nr:hypothetical protein [Bacillota bacterium]
MLNQLKTYANDTLLPNDPRLKEMPSKTFTADDVLNKKIHWKNPYNPDITPVTQGFDFTKVGKTPAKGIHPRIFTSPGEFADIKKRLETTNMGGQLLRLAGKELEQMQKGKGALGNIYSLLKSGNNLQGIKTDLPKEMANLLSIQGLLAQLNSNKALLVETGTVAANYLKITLQHIEDTPPMLGREKMVKEEIFSGGSLAKLFDFTAAGMNKKDKAIIVALFARNTFGKYSVGMDLPHHWRRWNHIPASSQYGLTILAIENEKGYDKRIYDCAADVAEDYLTYAYSPEGMSSEGITYTFGPFEHELLFMAAMARRGQKNLFTNPHFRAIPDWLIYALAPNPDCLWNSQGDTGSTSDIPWSMMMIMKYFFPDDAKIDYLYANSLYKSVNKIPDVSAFVFCNDPSKTAAQYNGIPPVNMPKTFFSPNRGTFIARDKWDKNGIKFQFDARQDMYYQSHDHADRGNFWLAANGRIWVMDGWRSTESKYHSVITIDGHGQGYFATPACWKNYIDKPEATFGQVDYKYAFDWLWLKTPVSDAMLGKPLPIQWQDGVYTKTAQNQLRYHPGQVPQRDPLRKVAEYFNGSLETDPRIWTEDTWPMRLQNYPVEFAFRTAGLVKGKHPYVLIIDDLKKDNAERLYEWTMPVQLDVEVVSIKQLVEVTQQSGAFNLGFNAFANNRTQGEYDIVLGDKRMKRNMTEIDQTVGGIYNVGRFTPQKGDPQLLVRVLERTAAEVPNLEPNPRLETFENIKTEDMHQFYLRTMDLAKRLVVPSRSNNPNFKVLLFPYLHGEELPQTLWNETRTKLTVTFKDQKDEFFFSKGDDNHTKIKLVRDGKVIFEF